MAKFKVGDKVKCISNRNNSFNIRTGREYEITGINMAGKYQMLELANMKCYAFSGEEFELSQRTMEEHERIADLERQLETWKVIQRTNDATIKMWQDIHQKDQQCLIHMAKRLNHVTVQCVELKRINEECAETIAMFKALNNE